jgi:hypothetical protein
LNPAKLGKIDNHKQEPWKLPLPQFIEQLHFERFGKLLPTASCLSRSDVESKGAKEKRAVPQAAAYERQHLKHGERRPRYCGAAVRGADSATTRGGDVRRSCRTDMRGWNRNCRPEAVTLESVTTLQAVFNFSST